MYFNHWLSGKSIKKNVLINVPLVIGVEVLFGYTELHSHEVMKMLCLKD